jgi:D-3-phosphoglycerate dehydrogenase
MEKVYIGSRTLTLNGHPALKKLEDAGLELIFGPAGERPTEEEQLRVLPECVAYLAGTEKISKKVLMASKRLKIISRNGVGIENIDLDTAQSLGIAVMITPGANAQGVAELTMALMLSAIRFIPLHHVDLKRGKWERLMGNELQNKILGVIGTGNIGKKVIEITLGLGMKVLGYDLFPDPSFNPSREFIYVGLEEIFQSSDIISLHIPSQGRPILDKDAFSLMKDGIYIINTARAELIDELELLRALNSKKVKIYATDVYSQEPPDINELISHPRTICTPHIGAYTEESINQSVEIAVENILNILGLNNEG